MKIFNFLLIACMCLSILMLSSCSNEGIDDGLNVAFWEEFVIDDSPELVDKLTREYDIHELKAYFENKNTNENIAFDPSISSLKFSDVNHEFPIEVIRSGGYSVYKVKQGGYFYVFWSRPYCPQKENTDNEPAVYFTCYLASTKSYNEFSSIRIGSSTANDVKIIDPSFELSFLLSHGIFSYSLLNNDSILEIEYIYQGDKNDYYDLVVKEITVISRSDSSSRFSTLLPRDIP